MSEALNRAVALLRGQILSAKARAYRRVFRPDDGELSPESARVLGDLKRFGRGDASTFDPDPYHAARLAGRREMWLRIVNYLDLDDAVVRKLVEVENDYVD